MITALRRRERMATAPLWRMSGRSRRRSAAAVALRQVPEVSRGCRPAPTLRHAVPPSVPAYGENAAFRYGSTDPRRGSCAGGTIRQKEFSNFPETWPHRYAFDASACLLMHPSRSDCAFMTDNREKLLHAAGRVYAEVGFRGATTRRIADEAGVNEVTLFRLFGSKSQLLAEAINCQDPMGTVSLPLEPVNPTASCRRGAKGTRSPCVRCGP